MVIIFGQILFVLISAPYAQSNLAQPVILSQEIEKVAFGSHLDILEDASVQLIIVQVNSVVIDVQKNNVSIKPARFCEVIILTNYNKQFNPCQVKGHWGH